MESSVHRSSPTASVPAPEEDDALWHVLGKCPPAPASGSFVADTLRAVRLAESRKRERGLPWAWWILAPALSCLLITGAVWIVPQAWQSWHATETASLQTEQVDLLTEELHLMTYVDELLTVSDPTTLDDAGLAELF